MANSPKFRLVSVVREHQVHELANRLLLGKNEKPIYLNVDFQRVAATCFTDFAFFKFLIDYAVCQNIAFFMSWHNKDENHYRKQDQG